MKNLFKILALFLVAISLHAEAATAALGQQVTLTVTSVGGTPPFTYQWKKDGVNIPDAINNRWFIPSMRPEDVGNYTVEVKNTKGVAVSTPNPISLEIVAPSNVTVTVTLKPI